MNRHILLFLAPLAAAMAIFSSCSDDQSYADLLREETKAINYFLAGQRVTNEIPADSISFETGENAPYYRMDGDGNVYMQVISKGDLSTRPEKNDLVYLRLTRYNLSEYYETGVFPGGYGNATDVTSSLSIRYDNYQSSSSSEWGEGIQLPLKYLGYGCEVNIVVRSQAGRNDEIAAVIPYLINVRYFKSNI